MIKLIKTLLVSLFLLISISGTSQINTDRVLEAGRYALYQQEYVLAISFFNKAIESKPYLGLPYYFRAKAKYNLDDLKGAELDMNKAIEIIPFYYEFYRFRGDIRGRLGKHTEALEDYDKGLEIEPGDLGIFFNRGLVHIDMKDWKKSIEDFSSVLKIDSAQYGAYIYRAIAKLNAKDTIGAVNDMDEAIAVNPLVAEAYRFSAAIYYDVNKFDKALERINSSISLDGSEPVYYMLRGVIRYQMDDLKGTMADFNKVINLQPNNIYAYANRGMLRTEIGDVNNAIDDFSRVLALNSGDLLTLFNRSLLYIRVGQFKDALSDLNLIIKRYPNYSDAYFARSQAYAGLNMQAEQAKDRNMAMKLQQDERKRAEENEKLAQAGTTNKKPKETRSEKDEDISNHDKIVVLDDFTVEDNNVDELQDLKGKIQNKNIIIDLEKVFSLTFFSEDNTVNSSRYFKPEVTSFNSRNTTDRTLAFSNKELENDGDLTWHYYRSIEEITQKLNVYPDNNDLRFVRAILYGVIMNYSNALNDYNYLISHASKDHPYLLFYYLNRAAIRYKMVEAMQSFEEEELPEDLITGVNTKKEKEEDKIVKQMLDYDLIERDLRQVVEINPGYEFAYYNLGILYCIKKDYKGAVRQFSNAIKLNPQFAEAYFNRGLTRIYLKQDSEGTMDLSRAGELGLYKAYNIIKRYGKQRVNVDDEGSED